MPPCGAVVYQDDHRRSLDYDVRRRRDAVVDRFSEVQLEDTIVGSILGQGRRQTPGSSRKLGYVERAQDRVRLIEVLSIVVNGSVKIQANSFQVHQKATHFHCKVVMVRLHTALIVPMV